MTSLLDALYGSLQKRLRPEDMAELVLSKLGDELSPRERGLLEKAAARPLKRGLYQITSLAQDFHRPIAPVRQARKAAELFQSAYALSDADCADMDTVQTLKGK